MGKCKACGEFMEPRGWIHYRCLCSVVGGFAWISVLALAGGGVVYGAALVFLPN